MRNKGPLSSGGSLLLADRVAGQADTRRHHVVALTLTVIWHNATTQTRAIVTIICFPHNNLISFNKLSHPQQSHVILFPM